VSTNPYPNPIISSPPPALPEKDPDDDAIAARDPRAVPPGTAKSSLAAVPAWARGATTKAPTYAPVHSRAVELFSAGGKPQGDVTHAVIVCGGGRARWEADLHLQMTVGKTTEVAADGAKQANTVYVSAPLVDLKDGVPIQAVLSERRGDGLTEILRMNVTAGDELRRWSKLDIDCVALAGDALQDRIAADLGRADSALMRFSKLAIDPTEVWGSEVALERTRVERRISDVAALAGWDHPSVKSRLAFYDAASRRLSALEQAAFADAQRTASRRRIIEGLAIEFRALDCSSEACEMTLLVSNREDFQQSLSLERATRITVLRQDKERLQAFTDMKMDPVILPPHEERKVVIGAPKGLQGRKSLAQLCVPNDDDTTCGMIALY
jgi:hypothetical protein